MKLPSMSLVKKLTSQFGRRKILVVGDVGVDKYTVGRVTRISPEAPIPIVDVQQTVLKLGLAANVADNISSLGGTVYMVGVVGKDGGAAELKSLMKRSGIDSKWLVSDSKRNTTIKERVVAEQQQVVRIDHESKKKVDSQILKQAWSRVENALDKADAVIIEDYAKGFIDASICRQIMTTSEERGIPVFVDPNSKSSVQLYFGCAVMTPNASEAEALTGIKITDYESLVQAGLKLLEDAHAKIVIITRGREGMAIFRRGEHEPVLIPTFAREVYDVSGAGDTTIATLALAMASGADVVDAAMLANSAAGIVVGKRGTATTTVDEIREYVSFLQQFAKR